MTDTARQSLSEAQSHTIEAFDALRRAEKADTDIKMVQEVQKAVAILISVCPILEDVVKSASKKGDESSVVSNQPSEPVPTNRFKINWGKEDG